MPPPETPLQAITPDYSKTGDLVLKNQNSLRKLVGILGMLLPVALYLFIQVDARYSSILPSISHYYFTRAGGIFVICVSLLAVFLLIYKGEEPKDYFASSVAGIFALMVVLFPTDNLGDIENGKYMAVTVTKLNISDFRPGFHYLSAAIFLLTLAGMAFFLFTKSNQAPSKRTKRKIIRNRIYRVCAIVMVIAMAVVFSGFLCLIPPDFYDRNCITFWMEVVAIEAFGFAWLVKGEFILGDKKQ